MTPRQRREPRLDVIETCWRMVGPTKRPIDCGLYRTDAGIEVRMGYGEHDLLRSTLTRDIDAARDIAASWRGRMLAKGGFEELPRGDA